MSVKTTYPYTQSGEFIYELDDFRCPACGWSAEHEPGHPYAGVEFLRSGPLCRLCDGQLIASIKRQVIFDAKRGVWVPAPSPS